MPLTADNGGGATQRLDRAAIAAALAAGATVVTPSRRLAQALKREHDRARLAGGSRVWPAADVLPIGAWLQRLHADLADDRPPVLSPLQEQVLWEQAIDADTAALLNAAPLATAAAEAWALLQAQAAPAVLERSALSDDQAAFRRWAGEVERRLRALRVLTAAELPARLARDIAAGAGPLPARLLLAGFERLAPPLGALADALRARGVAVATPWAEARPRAAPVRTVCRSAPEQWRAIAAWSRDRLLARADARIGIVVPDLQAQREPLRVALTEALAPDTCLRPGDAPLPFNLSLGAPLAEAPLVHDALALFELLHAALPIERAGALLRSPFIGVADLGARAQVDAALRAAGAVEVDLARLLRAARAGAAPLAGALAQLRDLLAAGAERRLPSAWSALLFEALNALRFPGRAALDSAAYQTHQRLREAIAALATLDELLGRLRLGAAVARLRRLCADTLFQPETPAVPVQVLGVLEAAQLEFDHLWIANLADDRWPLAASPNPLLPLALQRQWELPTASAAHALAAARRRQAEWAAATAELVLSHAALDGDAPCLPSPLIAALPVLPLAALGAQADLPLAARLQSPAALAAVTDAAGPPLAPGEARGGTRLFTDQAACAFRAFASHRLHAEPLADPEPGLDALTRGSLLHFALEQFWRPLASQQALLALAATELEAAIVAAADHALARLLARRPDAIGPQSQALERERLRRALHAWLAVERGRPPFEVVTVEAEREALVAGIGLRVKPDRLDRVDGALVLIDYKTGSVAVRDWIGPRLAAPQLPLYAVTAAERISAVAFAQLRPGQWRLAALAERAGLLADGRDTRVVGAAEVLHERPGWDGLLADWRAELEQLAQAFLRGAAEVDPKQPATCEHCPLPLLCRIGERRAAAVDAERSDD